MYFKYFFPCLLFFPLLGCGSDSSKTTSTQNINVTFSSLVDGKNINCATILTNLGQSKASASIKDFRFYLSDMTLIGTDKKEYPITLEENEWQTKNVALIDFQDKADECAGEAKLQRLFVNGTVSSAIDFEGIRFAVGLPPDLNHIDIATVKGPLSVASLYWSWQSGYKFMRLDIAPSGGITRPSTPTYSASTFNFHLGSTNCSGEPESGEVVTCERVNRPIIELSNYSPAKNTINLNYAALIDSLNVKLDEQDSPGCMSGSTDPECKAFFKGLGLNLSSGKPDATLTQSVFSVE